MVVIMGCISSHFLPGWRAVGAGTQALHAGRRQGRGAQLCAKGSRSLIGSKRGGRENDAPQPETQTAAAMAAVM